MHSFIYLAKIWWLWQTDTNVLCYDREFRTLPVADPEAPPPPQKKKERERERKRERGGEREGEGGRERGGGEQYNFVLYMTYMVFNIYKWLMNTHA